MYNNINNTNITNILLNLSFETTKIVEKTPEFCEILPKIKQVLFIFTIILLIFNTFSVFFFQKLLNFTQKKGVFWGQSVYSSIYFCINLTVIIFMIFTLSRL